jgi:NAD(P)-dependent dehydrogenase (short-subunit alcohol dehydrogenase family)
MEQKTILITGGTSGIGKETAVALAKAGATVVITARTDRAGEEAQTDIVERSGNPGVSFIVCDLSSLDSVRRAAEAFCARHKRLDVLINNAGVLEQTRKRSRDGFEMDFVVNYLAPFLLTDLLLPVLKASAPSRIVNVSSSMHTEGVINIDDLQSENHFDRYQAYAQSKLALLLFTKKLAKELKGSAVTVNALHPGVIGTEMTMQNVRTMNPIFAFIFKRTLITPAQGAETSVYLATSPEVANVSGEYFDNKKIAAASPFADDTALTDRLWDMSRALVGL